MRSLVYSLRNFLVVTFDLASFKNLELAVLMANSVKGQSGILLPVKHARTYYFPESTMRLMLKYKRFQRLMSSILGANKFRSLF